MMHSKGKPWLQFYPSQVCRNELLQCWLCSRWLPTPPAETVALTSFSGRHSFTAKGMFCKSSLTLRKKFSEAAGTEQHNKARAPCATQVFRFLQTASVRPLCPGWHHTGASTWYPKDHMVLLTMLFMLFLQVLQQQEAITSSFCYCSVTWLTIHRENIPLVQSHVSEQLQIFARCGWVREPWQAKGLRVYLKMFICGHPEGCPWALTTKCMKS